MPSANEADAAAGMMRAAVTSAEAVVPSVSSPSKSKGQSDLFKPAAKVTKRQRRAAKNEKHAWPQHPKIQNAEQREKAYIRVAGLNESTKAPSSAVLDLDNTDDENKHTTLFARQLGSADARTRHQTVLKLRQYLKARCGNDGNRDSPPKGLSKLDLMKLWKCLWYTLYMADRVPVQAELSKHLASLLWSLEGTEEEDEFCAQAYLRQQDEEDYDDDDEGDDIDDIDEEDDVVMEEIENTLDEDDHDHDDDEISVESSEIDFEQKQMALLEEDGELEEDEDEENDVDDEDEENDGELEVDDEENDVDDEDEENDVEDDDNDQDDEGAFDIDEEEDEDLDGDDYGHWRGAHLASLFVGTFFRTVVREWGNMDKYRIDKFYTLIRDMMHAVFCYMAKRHWSIGLIRLFNDIIYDECLSQTPNGVRYHVIDVCLDELCKAAATAGLPLTEATLVEVLMPYFSMAQTGSGGDDTLHQRVVERILERFLSHCSVYSEAFVSYARDPNKKKQAPDGILDQVHVGTISQLIFDAAADEAVVKEEYRKKLYAVHKSYVRRINEIGTDHDVDIDDDEDDEDAGGGGSCCAKAARSGKRCDDVQCDVANEAKDERDDEEPVVDDAARRDNKAAAQTDAKSPRTDSDVKRIDARDDDKVATSKKRKKKKKTANSAATGTKADTCSVSVEEEEEITITIGEQRDARKRKLQEGSRAFDDVKAPTKQKKKSVTPTQQRAADTEQDSKRVKFGEMNKARSWKASMQGLRVMASPTTGVSPEKGILLNKGAKVAVRMERNDGPQRKKGRKKAVDYF